MTISVEVYPSLAAMPEELFVACAGTGEWGLPGLTLGWDGGLMQEMVYRQRARQQYGWVVVTLDGDTPIGWVVEDQSHYFQAFVAEPYRHRGIATRMIRRLWEEAGFQVPGYGNWYGLRAAC